MVQITKERRAKTEKKRDKYMEKKDLFGLTSRFVMILLFTLLHALVWMVIGGICPPPSLSLEPPIAAIIHGTFISLIIAYGYITKDKITSTLSSALLIPSLYFYIAIFSGETHLLLTYLLLSWRIILIGFAFFMLICGLAGYFASRGTKVSLLIAIFFGVLFIFIMLGMGH
jgi:hypothetical protein